MVTSVFPLSCYVCSLIINFHSYHAKLFAGLKSKSATNFLQTKLAIQVFFLSGFHILVKLAHKNEYDLIKINTFKKYILKTLIKYKILKILTLYQPSFLTNVFLH